MVLSDIAVHVAQNQARASYFDRNDADTLAHELEVMLSKDEADPEPKYAPDEQAGRVRAYATTFATIAHAAAQVVQESRSQESL